MRTARLTSATWIHKAIPHPDVYPHHTTPRRTFSFCIFASGGCICSQGCVYCKGIANDLSGGRQHILYTCGLMTSDQGPAIQPNNAGGHNQQLITLSNLSGYRVWVWSGYSRDKIAVSRLFLSKGVKCLAGKRFSGLTCWMYLLRYNKIFCSWCNQQKYEKYEKYARASMLGLNCLSTFGILEAAGL